MLVLPFSLYTMDGLGPMDVVKKPVQYGAPYTADGSGCARARSLMDLGPALTIVLRLMKLKDR